MHAYNTPWLSVFYFAMNMALVVDMALNLQHSLRFFAQILFKSNTLKKGVD